MTSITKNFLKNQFVHRVFLSFADKMSPAFNNSCPGNMVFYLPKCSTYAHVSWNEPNVTDNSGHVIISYPAVRPPANLSLGLYDVLYSARDVEGNTANCSFIVQVASMTFPWFFYDVVNRHKSNWTKKNSRFSETSTIKYFFYLQKSLAHPSSLRSTAP